MKSEITNRFDTISFRVSSEEKNTLQDYCRKNDIKMSQFIRIAVKEKIAREYELHKKV